MRPSVPSASCSWTGGRDINQSTYQDQNQDRQFGTVLTYVASVTTKLYNWITAGIVAFVLALVGFIVFIGMFTGEYWCEDRSPWWGPPTDPNSECSGLSWSSRHPGEYPWTLPR